MAEILQKRDLLALSIQNFVTNVKQFVRKYYITWLIDLPNKLYDIEKLLISFYVVLLKIVLFFFKKIVNEPSE